MNQTIQFQLQKIIETYLKRCASDKKTIVSMIEPHCFRKKRVLIFNPMCLINDNIAPAKTPKCSFFFDRHLKTSNTHIKLASHQQSFPYMVLQNKYKVYMLYKQ